MPGDTKRDDWKTPLLPTLETPETIIFRRIMVGLRDEVRDIVKSEMDSLRRETVERYDRIEAVQSEGVRQRDQISRDIGNLTVAVALNTQATELLDRSVQEKAKECAESKKEQDEKLDKHGTSIARITGIYMGAAAVIGALSGLAAGAIKKMFG